MEDLAKDITESSRLGVEPNIENYSSSSISLFIGKKD